MVRPREPISLIKAKGKKHLTKEEIEKREAEELKVPLFKVIPPTYLTKTEKDSFKNIAEKLLEIGIMTELDEDCLARYIIAKKLYLDYTKMLKKLISRKNKNDIEVDIDDINKMQNMQDKAFKQCQSSARDLGLTISSRCKLIIPQPTKEDDEDDDL